MRNQKHQVNHFAYCRSLGRYLARAAYQVVRFHKMEQRGKCIVLDSESGFSQKQLPLLRQFIDKGIELFCAQGKDVKNGRKQWNRYVFN